MIAPLVHAVAVGDRVLDVLAGGAPGRPALLCHHGTPSDATIWSDWTDAAERHGLQLLAYSRPGYAASTRRPGRDVAGDADDARAVLAHFGAEWCVTIGWSGGGPHALATAARVPSCRAAATLAGVGPFGEPTLDFLAGMGPENVEEFGAATRGEASVRAWLATHAGAMRSVTAPDIVEAFGGLVSEIDKRALREGMADLLAASIRRALAPGFDGWIDDDLAFAAPWGFALDAIAVPVSIWQGDLDLMVPFAHGAWLAARVPGAEARMISGHGHLSIGALRDEIVGQLVDRSR